MTPGKLETDTGRAQNYTLIGWTVSMWRFLHITARWMRAPFAS